MRTVVFLLVAGLIVTFITGVTAVSSGSGSGSGLGSGDGIRCEDAGCSQGYIITQRGECQCVCNPGYTLGEDGYSCSECPAGYYGEGCQQRCSCGDLGNTCNRVNGSCRCNDCWEGYNCSTYRGNDCLESFLTAVDKDDETGIDVPVLPDDSVELFIADMLRTTINLVDNPSARRIERENTRNLLRVEFTLLGSLDPVGANDALGELTTLIRSGDWRATCITNTAVGNPQDTDVTLNI